MPADDRLNIEKRLLSDEVADRLLADIIAGRFRTGQRLNVGRLADILGVSRTPVREGLNRVAQLGFVHVRPNSSTEVAHWGPDAIAHRLELIAQLAPLCTQHCLVHSRSTGPGRWGQSTTPVETVQIYLDELSDVARCSTNPVARQVMNDQLQVLRLFFVPAVLDAHRVNLELNTRSSSENLVTQIRSRDPHQFPTALSRFANALARAVSSGRAPASHQLVELRNATRPLHLERTPCTEEDPQSRSYPASAVSPRPD